MDQYDFISKKITEPQVKQIIAAAGYDPKDFNYRPRVDRDGYLVTGPLPMNLTRLRNAAKELNIKVEIISAPGKSLAQQSDEDPLNGMTIFGTDYKVKIVMSPDTVKQLIANGYFLYGFKAVNAPGSGYPLVWFSTQTISANTVITWSELYQAYTSTSELIPQGQIDASFSTDVDLGQTLNVIDPSGVGDVVDSGPATSISINNETQDQFVCGISQHVGSEDTPICGFPLFGLSMNVFTPVEKVLLMFSTLPVDTGTVIEQSFSSSLAIELTGAPDHSRTVKFDINKGWDWDNQTWAQQFPPNTDLVPVLINPTVDTSAKRVA